MVKANEVLSRLRLFAESFTGYPVRIVTSKSLTGQESAQTDNFLRIQIPEEINTKDKNSETEFKTYKGLVALQASAAVYNGILSRDLSSFNDPEKLEELRYRLSGTRDPVEHDRLIRLSNKAELINATLEERLLLTSCLNTFELSRRMQCIAEDYPILSEDMRDGFSNIFDPELIKKVVMSETEPRKGQKMYTVNEIDLAIFRAYWENMGINRRTLDSLTDKIPQDSFIGKSRSEIIAKLRDLSSFIQPLDSSYDDSLERTILFREFIDKTMERMSLGSPFVQSLDPEFFAKIERERVLRAKDRLASELAGLDTREVTKYTERRDASNLASLRYSEAKVSSTALTSLFQEVPLKRAVDIKIPEWISKEGTGKVLYFPELREGVLIPRAVKVSIYDLSRNQPVSEEQYVRQEQLERTIAELKEKEKKHDSHIRSDVCYIYDLQEEVKERGSAQRQIKSARKQLGASREIHEKTSSRNVEINRPLVKRIEREMEKIRPSARTMIRGCFEGELDEKKYFDWWLESQAGGHPMPNFYYQWQKRRRDVASVLLLDASHSTNRLANENETILDVIKKASYYFTIAADSLEDRTAVIAYNGKGDANSRVFLLKDFNEDPRKLMGRLVLLRSELNNRDGSAIRYATQHLSHYPAKTRFLFHIGDMQPSDKQYESSRSAEESYPYEGASALEDVTHAFRSARTQGIIPYGICISSVQRPKKEKTYRMGKINPLVLAKLKEKEQVALKEVDDAFLRRNFQKNYRVVRDMAQLPNVLRDAYLNVSFS